MRVGKADLIRRKTVRSGDFKFRTRVARCVTDGADDLFIMLVFHDPVSDEDSGKLEDFITEFSQEALVNDRVLNYMDDEIIWGMNNDRVTFTWDVGDQKPELVGVLRNLFDQVNNQFPIRRIHLHCGLS